MTVPELIRQKASRYGVDPDLALRVAWQESHYRQTARSKAGAIGVFQLMPATAAELGVNPFDLAENIDGGIRYLRDRIRQYGGDLYKALAAYNWGLGNLGEALEKYGNDWISYLPLETANYLAAILGPIRREIPAPGTVLAEVETIPMIAMIGLAGLALILILD